VFNHVGCDAVHIANIKGMLCEILDLGQKIDVHG
jgi:hypothetical protein